MGDKMRQFATSVADNEDIQAALSKYMLKGRKNVPFEVVGCLDDPDTNPEVREMIQNVVDHYSAIIEKGEKEDKKFAGKVLERILYILEMVHIDLEKEDEKSGDIM